jgi:NTE family protein
MPRNGSRAGRAAVATGPRGRKVSASAVPLALGLPGGGAHGAFAWGVLDRLLEEPDLAFPLVSGASAGAVNAVALACGFARGGREGARETLAAVWERTAALNAWSLLQPSPLDRLAGGGSLDFSPGYLWLDAVSRLFSPYQFNLFDLNPLREVLDQTLDFEAVRTCREVRVHISATNVRLGRIKVFGPEEITLESVLASSCLPFLNQAVEIGGEAYWDGAYLANPPLRPLAEAAGGPQDLLLIELEGTEQVGPPTSPQAIFDRLNSLSGAGGLLAELEWLAATHPGMRLHAVGEPEAMGRLNASSRLNADRAFLAYLRDLGRQAAEAWLAGPRASLGRDSSFRPPSRYL